MHHLSQRKKYNPNMERELNGYGYRQYDHLRTNDRYQNSSFLEKGAYYEEDTRTFKNFLGPIGRYLTRFYIYIFPSNNSYIIPGIILFIISSLSCVLLDIFVSSQQYVYIHLFMLPLYLMQTIYTLMPFMLFCREYSAYIYNNTFKTGLLHSLIKVINRLPILLITIIIIDSFQTFLDKTHYDDFYSFDVNRYKYGRYTTINYKPELSDYALGLLLLIKGCFYLVEFARVLLSSFVKVEIETHNGKTKLRYGNKIIRTYDVNSPFMVPYTIPVTTYKNDLFSFNLFGRDYELTFLTQLHKLAVGYQLNYIGYQIIHAASFITKNNNLILYSIKTAVILVGLSITIDTLVGLCVPLSRKCFNSKLNNVEQFINQSVIRFISTLGACVFLYTLACTQYTVRNMYIFFNYGDCFFYLIGSILGYFLYFAKTLRMGIIYL